MRGLYWDVYMTEEGAEDSALVKVGIGVMHPPDVIGDENVEI
jgi:hypothetical protein